MAAKAMFRIFDITKLDQVPLYGASDQKRKKSDEAKKTNKSESTKKTSEKDRFSRNGSTNLPGYSITRKTI